ncbi:MAG TPA: isoaspartyl peptidase/L-asparaginase [Flavipsychrobacter sp.]|nr:isoaspartyl peptidase/L-asparaginase [Flavipsychrobacter sp.]
MNNFSIAIHGGAGTILKSAMTQELQAQFEDALQNALDAGYTLLERGASSLDAVEAAVAVLENFPLFNAGKGSVFNHLGKHEMDASIMEGQTLAAGAVSGISNVKNPIKLARVVMEKSEHVMLFGKGAEEFAKHHEIAFEPDDYFYNEMRYKQWQEAVEEGRVMLDHSERKFGTVGAVALDQHGNLAAATSTGGMTNKKFGRVGDTPIIGAGTYANNHTCAVSCTGHGELFIRTVVGHDISCLMEYKGLSLQEACDVLVHDKLVKIGGEGGLIAVDNYGNVAMLFNSEGMYRGCRTSEGGMEVKIYKE